MENPFKKARLALDTGAPTRAVLAELVAACEKLAEPEQVPVTVQEPKTPAESQTPVL